MASNSNQDEYNKALQNLLTMSDEHIVEQAITANGREGYPKWAAGKIEHWGVVAFPATSGVTTAVVTFPTAFANTDFNFVMSGGRNIVSGNTLIEGDAGANTKRTTTTTVVRCEKTGENYTKNAYYRAVGVWKEV